MRRRNPATRGASWPYRVQHFDDRPQVRRWGDYRSFPSLEEAIRYVKNQNPAERDRWRVREGRRTVWIH